MDVYLFIWSPLSELPASCLTFVFSGAVAVIPVFLKCLFCSFSPSVIPNTLRVSPLTPPPAVSEGSDLTLSCNVTRELSHATYLSVTWSVKRGATSEDILTLGPQGDVVTGAKYARRYADGGIRLVPGRNGLFELVITKVTTSDDGVYECNGTEWTHDNRGKWTKIVASTREMGTVAVTPTGERRCKTTESALSGLSRVSSVDTGDSTRILVLDFSSFIVLFFQGNTDTLIVKGSFSRNNESTVTGKPINLKNHQGGFRL